MATVPTVLVLDDDEACAKSLERMVRSAGFPTRTWISAKEFLSQEDPEIPGCLICDLLMPEMSGLEVQQQLLARGISRPIVFVTGEGDMNVAVQGMRAGAVTFLAKPVAREPLVASLREALLRDASTRAMRVGQTQVDARLRTLTPRQRDILTLVVKGRLNKQIAAELGTSVKTVKVHRFHVMKKMHARNAAELAGFLSWSNASTSPAHSLTRQDSNDPLLSAKATAEKCSRKSQNSPLRQWDECLLI
jgi:FixJ family two-component response regulator